MTGPSGKLCLANTRLSLTELQTRLLFRPALFQFFHLLHPCSCHWRCHLLQRRTRLRHRMPPIWFTLASPTMLPTRMVLLQHPRRCHSCLLATPATRNRKRGAVMIQPLNLPPSVTPLAFKITHRHAIPPTPATTRGLHYPAFPFLTARHQMETFPCPSHKLTIYLL